MKRRPSRKEKRQRAWGAYLDLVDTAEWVQRKLGRALGMFGMSAEEFRLLVLLYREGPLTMTETSEKLDRNRQNLFRTIQDAAEFGWVRWDVKPGSGAEAMRRVRKDRRGGNNRGSRVGFASLTRQGEKLIESVLPKHVRMVDALMRALDGREQTTLSQMCRKLREEDELDKLRFASAMIRAHEGSEEE
jgi:DNA-binding MarR family transcriptional regulator